MEQSQFVKKVGEFIKKLEKDNINPKNLFRGDFMSKELYEEYLTLSEVAKELYSYDGLFKLDRIISENVKMDPKRIQKYYLWDIGVKVKEGIVFEIYPDVESLIDEDSLINIEKGSKINKNGFKYKDYYLIFDSKFSFNFHFTTWLIKNWKGQFSISVPIEKDLIGLPETEREYLLKSHWMGPKEISNVRESFAESEFIIKGPLNLDAPLQDKTEFLFKKRGEEWHLEIEELLPLEGISFETHTLFQGKKIEYFTKYIHAIVNEDITKCYHLDGSLREYFSSKQFKERNFSDLRNPKWKDLTKRHKIFKFNSEEGITSFQEIIGLFFINNPYIFEIFEGQNEACLKLEARRSRLLEYDLKKLKDFLD